MKEYGFDVLLRGVVRVRAADEEAARSAVRAIDCEDLHYIADSGAVITEVSFDTGSDCLYEVDGQPAARCGCANCGGTNG